MLNRNSSVGESYGLGLVFVSGMIWIAASIASAQTSLREQLKATLFKFAYECYVDGNWDIYVTNADGANTVNLTATPNEHEHYPQISPDGKRMCFLADTGEGRNTVRSLWVMDIDGKNRRKIADHAREPFWSPDGKLIGYLPQLYPKFSPGDGYSDGLTYYHVQTAKTEPHPNSANLHHLYNPSMSANGKWIAATVHAGMGFDHAIVLIAAHGDTIINLKIPGCRPCLSPDGKQIAWGAGDHELAVAPITLDSEKPAVGKWRLRILDAKNKIYHIDWSPDSRFLCFSRGPEGRGDPSKEHTYQAACEMIGVHAQGWDIWAVSAERDGVVDVNKAAEGDLVRLTNNGCSNKEPAWFWPDQPKK